ncbi:TatD family protein [Kipferlia bialata]|uniref:TatD family protein n=1 Tax=Kipferlia bialata TaxID=797122 RepID=A0A9K3CU68_9EUKA|nr:TatD family protein [Kipferlia bialata]|eukprot:g4542.t1
MARAQAAGVDKMIVTVGSKQDIEGALALCRQYPGKMYMTLGIHPTRSKQWNAKMRSELHSLLTEHARTEANPEGCVVAYGEFGLDYDRLHFADMETQKRAFKAQLALAAEFKLPLFLHERAAAEDFHSIIGPYSVATKGQEGLAGVVHSFTGDAEGLKGHLALGFDIGINGCSLKKEENVTVASMVPLDRLHLETDCPWCDIRASHHGHKAVKTRPYKPIKKEKYVVVDRPEEGCAPGARVVKSRTEPCHIVEVAEVLSVYHSDETCRDMEALTERVYNNTMKMYFPPLTAEAKTTVRGAGERQNEVEISAKDVQKDYPDVPPMYNAEGAELPCTLPAILKKTSLNTCVVTWQRDVATPHGDIVEPKGTQRGGLTASWWTPVNGSPLTLAVSVGHKRYSLAPIKETGSFCLNVLHPCQVDIAKGFGYASQHLLQDKDKFDLCGVTPSTGPVLGMPVLPGPISFECKVTSVMSMSDHDLIVGQVVACVSGDDTEDGDSRNLLASFVKMF